MGEVGHKPAARNRWSLAVLAAVSALVAGRPATAQTFTAPMGSSADPYVMQWQGQYFYTRTTGSDVRLSRSPELSKISTAPAGNYTVWNPPDASPYGRNIWAPELHRLNGKWYIYTAADNGNDVNHRMYVLEGNSQDPMGTYTLKGQISAPTAPNRWAIDGTVFTQNGKNYMIWSGRTNGTTADAGNSQSLYIAEMSNPWTLTGNRTRISQPTFSWEVGGHPVNEGPQVLRNGNDVFLMYSGSGYYTPSYSIGALRLTGSDPMVASSWTKLSTPLFQQGNGVTGPGHASYVKSPDGTEDWIVYHGRTAETGDPRQLFMQPFTWNAATGLPAFGSPIAPGTPIPVPSGRPISTYVANGSFDRPDVTFATTSGKSSTVESFINSGKVGVVTNDGRFFQPVAGGDGPQVATLDTGVASGIWQTIGVATRGTYTLSAGLAISSNELGIAQDNPGTLRLSIYSLGSGADAVPIAVRDFSTSLLEPSMFLTFDVAGVVPDSRDGTNLYIGVSTLGGADVPWSVKVSTVQLGYSAVVPEPGTVLAAAVAGGGLLLGRQRRRPVWRSLRRR